jgi:hypothetical protein
MLRLINPQVPYSALTIALAISSGSRVITRTAKIRLPVEEESGLDGELPLISYDLISFKLSSLA